MKEYAPGAPMCGCASRLKRMRSIASASVAVPTVERGLDAHPLLVDADRRRQPVEHVDVGPRQRRHEALHERAVGLVDQPLRLRGDRAEHQRALARARDAGEHGQPALRDLDADVLEVVHPRAVHADQVVAVGGVQRRATACPSLVAMPTTLGCGGGARFSIPARQPRCGPISERSASLSRSEADAAWCQNGYSSGGALTLVEPRALVVGELEGGRGEVVGELLLGARADDQRGDAGAAERPRERDLRGRDARAPRRSPPAPRRCRRGPPGRGPAARPIRSAGASRRAPRCRAGTCRRAGRRRAGSRSSRPTPWSIAIGHDLVLGVARLQRVVDLLETKGWKPSAAEIPSALDICQPA